MKTITELILSVAIVSTARIAQRPPHPTAAPIRHSSAEKFYYEKEQK
jgi:hypothetical protein